MSLSCIHPVDVELVFFNSSSSLKEKALTHLQGHLMKLTIFGLIITNCAMKGNRNWCQLNFGALRRHFFVVPVELIRF